jgi:hypothetical protein
MSRTRRLIARWSLVPTLDLTVPHLESVFSEVNARVDECHDVSHDALRR